MEMEEEAEDHLEEELEEEEEAVGTVVRPTLFPIHIGPLWIGS
jgi:hypothetical protein